jgi:hypothetical protein
MTVQITSDATADPALTNGIFPPVIDGLLGYWEHQGTIDRARVNLVDGTLSAVSGTPVMEANGMTCVHAVNFLTTAIPESAEMTLLSVAFFSAGLATGNRTACISNFSTTVGASLIVDGNSGTPGTTGRVQAQGAFNPDTPTMIAAQLGSPDITGFRLRAARISPAGHTINDLTAGLSATGAAGTNGRTLAAGTMRIGGGVTGYFNSTPIKLLRSAIYNRVLSDTELATMRAWINGQLAPLSITV